MFKDVTILEAILLIISAVGGSIGLFGCAWWCVEEFRSWSYRRAKAKRHMASRPVDKVKATGRRRRGADQRQLAAT